MGEPMVTREIEVTVKIRVDKDKTDRCSCACRWLDYDGWCDLFNSVLTGPRGIGFTRCAKCKEQGIGSL